MIAPNTDHLADIINRQQDALIAEWLRLLGDSSSKGGLDVEVRQLCSRFLPIFARAVEQNSGTSISGSGWDEARRLLGEFSRLRAQTGFTPTQTAMFIFSLKEALFPMLRAELSERPADMAEWMWQVSTLLDQLGLYTVEIFQQNRDQIIVRQQQELLELSTPVVKLWHDILALPLIGTLDSSRTQIVMESLLQKIIETGAAIAIIDITGVPTVDTLVAQHLLKTVAAARLMGADCIISGIRPQIAQTIVHLGVDLEDVTTKATLADAFMVALQRTGSALTHATNMSHSAKV